MEDVDTMLQRAGELWRAQAGDPPKLTDAIGALKPKGRRRIRVAVGVAAAIVAIAGLSAVLYGRTGGPASHSPVGTAASCVAPRLSVTPGRISRGSEPSSVKVAGRYYYSTCNDTAQVGQAPTVPTGNQPVHLTVKASDGSVIGSYDVTSDARGLFQTSIELDAQSVGSILIVDQYGTTAAVIVTR